MRLGLLFVVGLALACGFVYAGRQHFTALNYGYETENLRRERDQLAEQQRRLTLQREEAASPVRLEQAGTGRWCGPADRLGTRSCRYSTFENCLAAASDYRTCWPNPAAVAVPDDATYWTYRSVFL